MASSKNRFWETVRAYEPLLHFALVLDLLFLLLALIAVPFVEWGTATSTIVVIDVVICLLALLPISYLLYQCRRKRVYEQSL